MTWQLAHNPAIEVHVQSDDVLGHATNRRVTLDYLHKQLGRLGQTAYQLASLTANIEGNPFIPNSLLNRLRQFATTALASKQQTLHPVTTCDAVAILETALEDVQPIIGAALKAHLHLLVRTPEQLDAAIAANPSSITLDYLELYGLRPSVQKIWAAGITPRVASPRILKPQEQRVVNFLLRLDCPIVVRSSGLLHALQGRNQYPLIGDFSLNVANQLAADTYFRLGIDTMTPTHDLNADQICTLAQAIGAQRLEVIAYHHLPVFHTEHCVFCRFMSAGTSYKDCGQPCERHKIALRDTQGRSHPVMADVGCRNTVFGAQAQVASRHIDQMMASDIRHYRLEFVHETPEEVAHVTDAFRAYFNNRLSSTQLDETLQQISPTGTTEGSFFIPLNYVNMPNLG